MIIEEIKKIEGSRRELRKFAFVMAVPLALIGGFLLWRQSGLWWYFLAAAGVFAFVGVTAPVVLKPVHTVWMSFAIVMGWVMTRVILVALFFVVLTPLALLLRLLGKDLLDLKFERGSSESYWLPRKVDESKKPDYTKQF